MKKCKSARIWQSRNTSNVISWTPENCRFNINPATGRKRLVILLPSGNTTFMSAGVITIHQFAAEVARNGIDILFCALRTVPADRNAFLEGLHKNLRIERDVLTKFEVVDARNGFSLNVGDKFLATASWTFPLAKYLTKRCNRSCPAYFIQDIEPLFWGFGVDHAELMQTYAEEMLPIVHTSTLAQMIYNMGVGTFAEEFAKRVQVFFPSLDSKLFYPTFLENHKKILTVYTRFGANESRNMPELIMESISRMANDGLLKPSEWEIHCMGCPDKKPFQFANGLRTIMLPYYSYPEYAREIRNSSLGISLILSPHPGYMPFEFAASGVPVITNTYLNKTYSFLKKISPNIYPASPTFDGISAQLRTMLQNGIYKRHNPACENPEVNLPKTWHESFASIMAPFMSWFNS